MPLAAHGRVGVPARLGLVRELLHGLAHRDTFTALRVSASQAGFPTRSLMKTDGDNWSPRVGLAIQRGWRCQNASPLLCAFVDLISADWD